tara:strand:+ start:6523 stop:6762 length:240 start_codon:yes stop_codon:yes gene_type:complete
MSKKKGKQMSNLPNGYILAMEALQLENDYLRRRALEMEIKVKEYDSLHNVVCYKTTTTEFKEVEQKGKRKRKRNRSRAK